MVLKSLGRRSGGVSASPAVVGKFVLHSSQHILKRSETQTGGVQLLTLQVTQMRLGEGSGAVAKALRGSDFKTGICRIL